MHLCGHEELARSLSLITFLLCLLIQYPLTGYRTVPQYSELPIQDYHNNVLKSQSELSNYIYHVKSDGFQKKKRETR